MGYHELKKANKQLNQSRARLKRAIKAARAYDEGQAVLNAELKQAIRGYYIAQNKAYQLRRDYLKAA